MKSHQSQSNGKLRRDFHQPRLWTWSEVLSPTIMNLCSPRTWSKTPVTLEWCHLSSRKYSCPQMRHKPLPLWSNPAWYTKTLPTTRWRYTHLNKLETTGESWSHLLNVNRQRQSYKNNRLLSSSQLLTWGLSRSFISSYHLEVFTRVVERTILLSVVIWEHALLNLYRIIQIKHLLTLALALCFITLMSQHGHSDVTWRRVRLERSVLVATQ